MRLLTRNPSWSRHEILIHAYKQERRRSQCPEPLPSCSSFRCFRFAERSMQRTRGEATSRSLPEERAALHTRWIQPRFVPPTRAEVKELMLSRGSDLDAHVCRSYERAEPVNGIPAPITHNMFWLMLRTAEKLHARGAGHVSDRVGKCLNAELTAPSRCSDGTTGAGTYSFVCPDVSPNSKIYFYRTFQRRVSAGHLLKHPQSSRTSSMRPTRKSGHQGSRSQP